MGTISIYHEENNATYSVTFDLRSTLMSDGDATYDYYLVVSTNIPKSDGTSFGTYTVKSLSDVPAGSTPPASTWTELCQWWIEYFMDQAELGYSSSSSTESSSSSTSSSVSSSTSSSSESSNSSSSESSTSSSSLSTSSSSSTSSTSTVAKSSSSSSSPPP